MHKYTASKWFTVTYLFYIEIWYTHPFVYIVYVYKISRSPWATEQKIYAVCVNRQFSNVNISKRKIDKHVRFLLTLRYATRDTRICFLYARHENKKNYGTRHATRDTSVYLTMGRTVTSAIFRITKCLF